MSTLDTLNRRQQESGAVRIRPAADHCGRGNRQNQHARAPRGASRAVGRQARAHSAAHLHAPGRARNDAPHPAHRGFRDGRAKALCHRRANPATDHVHWRASRGNVILVAQGFSPVRLPWSGTFHSIANRLIRRHAAAVGLDASFSVLDRGDAADLMDVLRHELGFSKAEKRFPRKDTCLAIYSHRVNTQRPLAETLDALFPVVRRMGVAAHRSSTARMSRRSSRIRRSTTTTCCSTGTR